MKNSNENDKYFDLAIKMAIKAFNADEVPVGCVIIDAKGQVIASAFNQTEMDINPTNHAEIIAIKQACSNLKSKNLSGCSAYLTLAPCIMCATAFTYARIDNVYYCSIDNKNGDFEKCLQLPKIDKNLYKTNFCYICNKFTDVSKNLLQDFFKNKRIKK